MIKIHKKQRLTRGIGRDRCGRPLIEAQPSSHSGLPRIQPPSDCQPTDWTAIAGAQSVSLIMQEMMTPFCVSNRPG
jgi:hypothetical protein